MTVHVHQPPPTGVLLEQEERIPVAGRSLEVAHPPTGYRHLPDLGIIASDRLDVRRLHAFPPPNDMSEPVRALKTPGGDLLAITQSGSGHMINNPEKINELLAYRSGDGGATWQGPAHPWEVPYNQHGFNPLVPRGSTRIVAFGTEPTPELFLPPHDGGIGVRRSDDDGHTWSEVEIIDPVNSRGYCGVGHMRGCEMDSGAWLLPTYSVRKRTDRPGRTDTQFVLRSEDRGASWTLIPGPHPHGWQTQPWQRTLEGTILSLGGSDAVMFARVPSGRMWELRSADDGRTWSDPEPTVLRHPDAPPMVFWLADGSYDGGADPQPGRRETGAARPTAASCGRACHGTRAVRGVHPACCWPTPPCRVRRRPPATRSARWSCPTPTWCSTATAFTCSWTTRNGRYSTSC